MRTKPLVLLVALFLTLTLLPEKMLAQGASLPTELNYFNPADPGDVPNPNGFNLNFVEAPAASATDESSVNKTTH